MCIRDRRELRALLKLLDKTEAQVQRDIIDPGSYAILCVRVFTLAKQDLRILDPLTGDQGLVQAVAAALASAKSKFGSQFGMSVSVQGER